MFLKSVIQFAVQECHLIFECVSTHKKIEPYFLRRTFSFQEVSQQAQNKQSISTGDG